MHAAWSIEAFCALPLLGFAAALMAVSRSVRVAAVALSGASLISAWVVVLASPVVLAFSLFGAGNPSSSPRERLACLLYAGLFAAALLALIGAPAGCALALGELTAGHAHASSWIALAVSLPIFVAGYRTLAVGFSYLAAGARPGV
ncbi:MAG: hypothetical protein JST54_28420 [Deltaproteobacteria bacterium]|nr:hypothetical protein [Deltaproteobacteria bacterium]